MKIMGIDPGTQIVGYGVIDATPRGIRTLDYGVVRCKKKAIQDRLKEIYDGLSRVAGRHKPSCIVLEKAFFARNVASTLRMGEGRGVALLCAANMNVPVVEYSPNEVKAAVTSSGHAAKSQVQFMIKAILGLDRIPEPSDAADALAMALCHANRVI